MVSFGAVAQKPYKTVGNLQRFEPALDAIVSPAAQAEIIAEGLEWSEGPLWVEKYKMLLFSDVPRNTIYKWTEQKGKEVYLTPSGYTGAVPRGGELGSNGLTLDHKGRLVLCQDGNRQMAVMEAPLDKPTPRYRTIASTYKGKKFNSPNDAVYNHKGELFFTDPPYGLEKKMDDPLKELSFQGVFKVTAKRVVELITDTITRPNGIGFLPGEKTLLVANSDPQKPVWYAYDLTPQGGVSNAWIFYSAAGYDKKLKGLPDGFKVDRKGNVFAAGPGGLYIFNKEGKVLGLLQLPEATSNCALSADEKTVYITNHMQVLRFKMRN